MKTDLEAHSACLTWQRSACRSFQALAGGGAFGGAFGEGVMVLHRRGFNVKQGPQWVPGIWLGKTEVEDFHTVAIPHGVIRGRAIRKTFEPWRSKWLFLVIEKLHKITARRMPRNVKFGGSITPRPVDDVQPAGTGGEVIDYDAVDVQNYAQQHPHTDDEEEGERPEDTENKRSHEGEQFTPHKSARTSDGGVLADPVSGATGNQEVSISAGILDDSVVEEPSSKATRISPDSSPSSKALLSPFFAGNALQVVEVDDEKWEDAVQDFIDDDENFQEAFDENDGEEDEGNPPVLSPDELAVVDEQAGYDEIQRLLEMKAIRDPAEEEFQRGTILSTRSVYDWRFIGQWKRRCRLVARDLKGCPKGTSKTFAPTAK